MKYVKLGDVCRIVSGSTPKRARKEYWGGDIPWVTPKEISALNGPFLSDSVQKITKAGYDSCSTTMLPKNSLLLSSRAPIGLLAINKIPVCTNQGFKSLVPTEDVSVEYLYYLLKSKVENLKAKGNGATFKELSKKSVERFQIPLPSYEDQIRIATLLSRVEALIATRKNNLQQLDDFLKSTFLEMFGDPVRNEKGWPTHKCSEVVPEIISGTSYGGEERHELQENEMGVLKISAVTEGAFNPKEIKAVNKSDIRKKLFTVHKGDFLLSRANTKELVAACCIVDQDYEKLFLPDKLWRLAFNNSLINPRYFNYLLKNERFRNKVRKLASGGHQSMLNISMKKFWTLDVVVPKKELQDSFEGMVLKVESLRTAYENSLSELETLYAALSQKAFKGELDLSRIPLPEEQQTTEHTKHTEKEQEKTSVPSVVKKDFSKPAQRQQLFNQWFSDYQAAQTRQPFDLDAFWKYAEEQARAVETEDSPPLGLSDYEQLKTWLFEQIRADKLEQTFSLDSKQIELKQQ